MFGIVDVCVKISPTIEKIAPKQIISLKVDSSQTVLRVLAQRLRARLRLHPRKSIKVAME